MRRIYFLTVLLTGVFLTSSYSQNFWEATNAPCSVNVQIGSLAINSGNNIFAATVGQGAFRTSNNGENWVGINNGLTDMLVIALAINSSDQIFAGTILSGAFRSTDNGENWTQITNGLTTSNVVTLAIDSNDHIFAGSTNGVYRSTNNGDNWIQINNGLTNTLIWPLAINSSNHIFVGTYGGGIFRSTDNGESWIQINNGLTDYNVWAVAINSSDHIFAGTGFDGVFRSTNNGENWSQTGLDTFYIRALAINSFDHIFAGNDMMGVFRSTDNGNNWFEMNSGLTDLSVVSFAVNSEGFIFAGTLGGKVFRSINSTISVELMSFTAVANKDVVELNWSTATETNNRGFSIERKSTNSEYSEIGFVPGFGTTTEPKLYSYNDSEVSGGKYTYRLKQIEFDGSFEYSDEVEIDVSMPWEFSLAQNYPNPFNPSTKISWQVPVGGWQTLKIYDVLGNEVATLVDEYRPAGKYEVEYDASSLTSGVYFYQLQAINPESSSGQAYIETKKMILLK